MVETKLGGRPAEIIKEDDHIKINFHPIAKGVKHPKATVFSIKLAKSDLDIIKKAL